MKLSEKALFIARRAHLWQYRKDGKTPYINHPICVADWIRTHLEITAAKYQLSFDDFPVFEIYLSVAYLHDVLEDTDFTEDMIYDELIQVSNHRFVEAVISGVKAITKNSGENYNVYLARVKSNIYAHLVKIFDINHNLSDSPNERQKEEYLSAKHFLGNYEDNEIIYR